MPLDATEIPTTVHSVCPHDRPSTRALEVESIWPNAAFEEGMGINSLVSADAGPPLGGAVFHGTAIWVRPA